MALETITRDEFDKRLEASTQKMRQEMLALEAQASELENLIGRYASVLEKWEASNASSTHEPNKDTLRALLNELSERTAQVAAAL